MILALALALAAARPTTAFDPLTFFTGRSQGRARLKVMLKPTVPVRIESLGRPDGKGGITLDQVIHEAGKPARQRRWVLRPTSPTTLEGSITDTAGPVKGWMKHNVLHLAYPMNGGLRAEQLLTLQPGGRTVINRMTVRKFGLAVAHVEEVITKLD